MNLEKLKPWNWFKHEEPEKSNDSQIPVTRREASQLAPQSGADSLMQLHREMDQLFDNVFNAFGMPSMRSRLPERSALANGLIGQGHVSSQNYAPNIDVSGDDKQYEIALDVPGMAQDDIAIEVHGDVLSIKGKQEEKSETKDKHFYRVERRYGSFQRTLALPEDANASDITANLKDGVLNLSIPRRALPASDVKRIPISG